MKKLNRTAGFVIATIDILSRQFGIIKILQGNNNRRIQQNLSGDKLISRTFFFSINAVNNYPLQTGPVFI